MIPNNYEVDVNPIELTLKLIIRTLSNLVSEKKLKFKKLYPDVIAPQKAHSTDMCFDIYAYSDPIITDTYIEYKTGIVFEIPEGYDMLLFPRSSISNYDLVLANSVGILDQNYRNEAIFRFKPTNNDPFAKIYKSGDRIGQITILPKVNYSLIEVDVIDTNTDRGLGGFGSSGN